MPRLYLMTWEPKLRRWRKMYRGKYYTISCYQLGVPETEKGSYQDANTWWEKKKRHLDATPPERTGLVPYPEHVIQVLSHRQVWAAKHDPGLAKKLSSDIAEVKRLGESLPPKELFARFLPEDGIVDSWAWHDRLTREKAEPTPVDRTVKALISKYLTSQELRARAGEITQAEAKGRGYSLQHLEDFLGPDSPIDVLTPERWQAWYESLLSSDRSRSYASKLLSHSRWFVKSLDELGIITAPKNLDKKSIKVIAPQIRIFTIDEIRSLWSGANPTQRLLIGLSLNTGMQAKDLSDLAHDEVDWDRGVITRKRSKSRASNHANAPVVSYQLWPEVFELLKSLRSGDPTRVLVYKAGRPWVDRQGKNVDNVRVEFAKLAPTLPYKNLRKTSSSLLASSPEYGRYAQYFLGHAPSTIADTHYVKPNEAQFSLALTWLREQYFPPPISPSFSNP